MPRLERRRGTRHSRFFGRARENLPWFAIGLAAAEAAIRDAEVFPPTADHIRNWST
jgi:hypothetical protein